MAGYDLPQGPRRYSGNEIMDLIRLRRMIEGGADQPSAPPPAPGNQLGALQPGGYGKDLSPVVRSMLAARHASDPDAVGETPMEWLMKRQFREESPGAAPTEQYYRLQKRPGEPYNLPSGGYGFIT